MLPYDRKRAFRKQWLYLGTFLTVIFLTVTNLEMVAEVLRSGRKLGAGWTESYILKVLTGDGIRLYFPLLCTVPYATGFVDEYKSGIYKFVLVRKERKKYIISKAITKVMLSNKKSHSVVEILNTKPARIATRADKACLRILRSSLIDVKIPVIANSKLEVKSRFFHFRLLSCESIGCQNLFL